MAIANPRDFEETAPVVGPKTALAAFYILVAILAMGVAIPAAIMSADTALFID